MDDFAEVINNQEQETHTEVEIQDTKEHLKADPYEIFSELDSISAQYFRQSHRIWKIL